MGFDYIIKNMFSFTGKEFDEETGNYYMSARYMNPAKSRWLSADPAGPSLINPMEKDENGKLKMRSGFSVVESLNWYSYTSNNPINYFDPTGMYELQINDDGSTVTYVDQTDLEDVNNGLSVFGANSTDNGIGADGQLLEHKIVFTDSDGNELESFNKLSKAHEYGSKLLDEQYSFGLQMSVMGADIGLVSYDSVEGFQMPDYNGASATLFGFSAFYKAYANNMESSGNGASFGLSKHLGFATNENSVTLTLGGGIGSPISPVISADTIHRRF